jgi:hypothetical protein
MVTIDARVLGRKQPLVPEWSLEADASSSERTTLRALITLVVREEVGAFRARQQERSLLRVLTEARISEGAAAGKIDPGSRPGEQEVEEEAAVATALQAFQDGLYLVLLDGEEQADLDRALPLKAGSRVTFLRLVMLAGGSGC